MRRAVPIPLSPYSILCVESLRAQTLISMILSSIKAVFFDLDDTLCAYWHASKVGMRMAFERHRPAGFTADQMIQDWAAAFRDFYPLLKKEGWYDGYLKSGEPTRTELMRLMLERMGIIDEGLAN